MTSAADRARMPFDMRRAPREGEREITEGRNHHGRETRGATVCYRLGHRPGWLVDSPQWDVEGLGSRAGPAADNTLDTAEAGAEHGAVDHYNTPGKPQADVAGSDDA
jgi:hypothetical protein